MSYKITLGSEATKEIKQLSKKYRLFKLDFAQWLTILEEDPIQGEPLGRDCYKVRLAIRDKRKGKSGGARAITCVKIVDERVIIVAVYDKSELDTLSDAELIERLKNLSL